MTVEPWSPPAPEPHDPAADPRRPRDFAEVADDGEKSGPFACHQLLHGGHGCSARHHAALV
ncbi:MAG: hypothetical protein HOV79_01835 [Hamadaea sp.]|nr:hypothetical protein [Hamadaea sp.]